MDNNSFDLATHVVALSVTKRRREFILSYYRFLPYLQLLLSRKFRAVTLDVGRALTDRPFWLFFSFCPPQSARRHYEYEYERHSAIVVAPAAPVQHHALTTNMMRRPAPLMFAVLAAMHCNRISNPTTTQCQVNALVLLSDLPTPSFVLDVRAMRKRHDISPSSELPSLSLPKHDMTLFPFHSVTDEPLLPGAEDGTTGAATIDRATSASGDDAIPLDLTDRTDQAALAYFHTSVVKSKSDVEGSSVGKGGRPFLAELDLPPSLCGSDGARLVLGLNNHHVGSYYWARSAGAGSSMDAIGVAFVDDGNDNGVLCWEDDNGPMACNYNDGKRSEWCNFLRPGDTVQLVPMGSTGEDALVKFLDDGCVFGVSSENRPMGSEPEVVCVWRGK